MFQSFFNIARRLQRLRISINHAIGVRFVMVAAAASLAVANPASAAANSPAISLASGGGGVPIIAGAFTNVDAIGYQTTEYFLSGQAHSYVAVGLVSGDGKWNNIVPNWITAPYKTRVVVYAPKDKTKFNGTVYVEWLNDSGLADSPPDWTNGHIEVAREGAIYILVSAQAVGVATLQGQNASLLPKTPYPLSDPVRYGSLSHPGDDYAYDIFSQVAQAVRDGGLLGGLTPKRVIGLGQSQSAFRLTTYVNAVQKLANVYDGFLLQSSWGFGTGLSLFGQVGITKVRDDLVPVLLAETETDVSLSLLNVRQPDSAKFRLWEVAGTAHYDAYGLQIGPDDVGKGDGEVQAFDKMRNVSLSPTPDIIICAQGINAGPMHWVYNAALNAMNRWIKDGIPPAKASRLSTTSLPGLTVKYQQDAYGNTLGGIRTPYVDVPIATLTGSGNGPGTGGQAVSAFCGIFGQTIPFTSAQLATLYPNHSAFVNQYLGSALSANFSGFLLWDDAVNLVTAASLSNIGNP